MPDIFKRYDELFEMIQEYITVDQNFELILRLAASPKDILNPFGDSIF